MAPLLRSDGAFFVRKWGFLGDFGGNTIDVVCGMPHHWDCGGAGIAVPLPTNFGIRQRVQAAPRQFEYIRLHSACTELADEFEINIMYN